MWEKNSFEKSLFRQIIEILKKEQKKDFRPTWSGSGRKTQTQAQAGWYHRWRVTRWSILLPTLVPWPSLSGEPCQRPPFHRGPLSFPPKLPPFPPPAPASHIQSLPATIWMVQSGGFPHIVQIKYLAKMKGSSSLLPPANQPYISMPTSTRNIDAILSSSALKKVSKDALTDHVISFATHPKQISTRAVAWINFRRVQLGGISPINFQLSRTVLEVRKMSWDEGLLSHGLNDLVELHDKTSIRCGINMNETEKVGGWT